MVLIATSYDCHEYDYIQMYGFSAILTIDIQKRPRKTSMRGHTHAHRRIGPCSCGRVKVYTGLPRHPDMVTNTCVVLYFSNQFTFAQREGILLGVCSLSWFAIDSTSMQLGVSTRASVRQHVGLPLYQNSIRESLVSNDLP